MAEKYRWERLTASGKVSPSPVNIGAVIITPKVTKYAIVKLYDGESSGDPQVIKLQSAVTETKVIIFYPSLSTQRGLYVDFTGDVDEVLIYYDWEKE